MVTERRTTYIDVIAWALARSKHDRFTADTRKWHEFVLHGKKLLPEVFKYVFFDHRAPTGPYSEEAEQALHALTKSGLLSLPNPVYEVIDMKEDQKQSVIDHKPSGYSEYETAVLELASRADELLAPPI